MGKVVERRLIPRGREWGMLARRYWIAVLALLLSAILFFEILYLWSWTTALPVLRVSPQFTLQTSNGELLPFRNLTGKVRLLTFFVPGSNFAATGQSLATLQQDFRLHGQMGTTVAFVTVSLAPSAQTAFGMMSREFHPLAGAWYLASLLHLQQVLQGYGLSLAEVQNNARSGVVETFLIDQAGNVRKIYTSLAAQEVKQDVENLLTRDSDNV